MGNEYDMSDEEYSNVLREVGLSCREDYYAQLRKALADKVDLSFSIHIYENFITEMVGDLGVSDE